MVLESGTGNQRGPPESGGSPAADPHRDERRNEFLAATSPELCLVDSNLERVARALLPLPAAFLKG